MLCELLELNHWPFPPVIPSWPLTHPCLCMSSGQGTCHFDQVESKSDLGKYVRKTCCQKEEKEELDAVPSPRPRGKLGVDLSLTFDPLNVGETMRIPWYRGQFCLSKANTLTLLFWPFVVVWSMPMTYLWPLTLNHNRSDKEVTVDTYACLFKTNNLTLLIVSFKVVCNITLVPFDPCDPI